MEAVIAKGTVIEPAVDWADPKLTVTGVSDDCFEGTSLPRFIDVRVDESPMTDLKQGSSLTLPGHLNSANGAPFGNARLSVVNEDGSWKCYAE